MSHRELIVVLCSSEDILPVIPSSVQRCRNEAQTKQRDWLRSQLSGTICMASDDAGTGTVRPSSKHLYSWARYSYLQYSTNYLIIRSRKWVALASAYAKQGGSNTRWMHIQFILLCTSYTLGTLYSTLASYQTEDSRLSHHAAPPQAFLDGEQHLLGVYRRGKS
jgi:hypothetical protein